VTVGDIRRSLAASHAAAAATLGRSRAFIGDCFVTDDRTVGDAESIEFLPPVSGG
jgi:molybdopterin converting factor small subunit